MVLTPINETHVAALTAGIKTSQAVEIWLWIIIALVFAMVVVGGATRLTDSGLSITEWQPLLGAIPPVTDGDWLAAFEKYKQIPQYALVNKGMALTEFKFIYWWEWSHRLLGRFIGVAFALPFLFFWATGRLRAGLALKLVGLLVIGALQGAIGWYMVKSGLADRVSVSQYRLALHLGTAFAIIGLLVWLARDESVARGGVQRAAVARGVRMGASIITALVGLQVVLGAFVAGLKAGLVYNTWPMMNGEWIPGSLNAMTPWYRNFFENMTTVQFDHRMVAYAVAIAALAQVFAVANLPSISSVRRSAFVLAGAVFAQVAIGILTLLSGVKLGLGLAHQAGAALVLIAAVWHLHATYYARIEPRAISDRTRSPRDLLIG